MLEFSSAVLLASSPYHQPVNSKLCKNVVCDTVVYPAAICGTKHWHMSHLICMP